MPATGPGTVGPQFAEPGFSTTPSYLAAGFQATVNQFGGNLLVSATDVEIPHQGIIGLWFRRTHNSNVMQTAHQSVAGESDSPLGDGWTSHYGVLWTAAPNVPRPEFIDNSGARHLFYPHTLLADVLPIASPAPYPTYISAQLEILRQIDDTQWELFAPNGLKTSFEKLTQYEFLVPTGMTDAFGNSSTITYEADVNLYFQHPLPKKITDGLNRFLEFSYTVVAGKKRLSEIRLDGHVLASYAYITRRGAPIFGLMKRVRAGLQPILSRLPRPIRRLGLSRKFKRQPVVLPNSGTSSVVCSTDLVSRNSFICLRGSSAAAEFGFTHI
jgi:hypothetical protein